MKHWTALVASPDVHTVAEGPLWDGPRDRLLWVDIEAGAVHIGVLDGHRVVRTDTGWSTGPPQRWCPGVPGSFWWPGPRRFWWSARTVR